MDEAEPLTFSHRSEWRSWLEEQHASASQAWLVFYKKNAGRQGLAYEDALEEALCFGWIDGLLRSLDELRYLLRFSPRKPNSLWSLANRERAERLIAAGKMTTAGLAAIENARRNGRWASAYVSSQPPETPPDLQRALNEQAEAQLRFDRLPPSHRTQYIFWVQDARKEDTRRRRIDGVVAAMLGDRQQSE